MTYRSDENEVIALIHYFDIPVDERDGMHEHDIIRDQKLVNTYNHWLNLSPVQRFVWLDKAKAYCEGFRSWGDDEADVEASAYCEAVKWLRGEFEYEPPLDSAV